MRYRETQGAEIPVRVGSYRKEPTEHEYMTYVIAHSDFVVMSECDLAVVDAGNSNTSSCVCEGSAISLSREVASLARKQPPAAATAVS